MQNTLSNYERNNSGKWEWWGCNTSMLFQLHLMPYLKIVNSEQKIECNRNMNVCIGVHIVLELNNNNKIHANIVSTYYFIHRSGPTMPSAVHQTPNITHCAVHPLDFGMPYFTIKSIKSCSYTCIHWNEINILHTDRFTRIYV